MDRPDVPRAVAAVPTPASAGQIAGRARPPALAQAIQGRTTMQAGLLAVSFVALVVSWSLNWNILLDTPFIDVTGLEPTLLAGGLLLVVVRGWTVVRSRDRWWLALVSAYLGWLVAVSITHSPEDIKKSVAYLFFFGVSLAVALVAARLDLARAARWVVAFFAVMLLVALLGAILEHLTYPPEGARDPLEGFWSLFRRRAAFVDPNVGLFKAGPAHYPLGEPGIFRTAGVFAHPVYLAFFGLLATGVMTGLVIATWRHGRRRTALAWLVGLGVAVFVTYWTYSRAPLAAVLGVVPFAAVVELAIRTRRLRRRPRLADFVPGGLAVAAVVLVLGTSISVDNLGLRRLAGTTFGILASDIGDEASVEASAARTTALRLAAQRLAVEMLADSPGALLTGTGMAAYEVAIAEGPNRGGPDPISHPHNAWLTEMLGGGIPAAVLFGLLLGSTCLAALRALPRTRDIRRAALLLGLGAWIPIWAVAQLAGLHPFMAHEAVILGSMLGFARGFAVDDGTPSEPTALAIPR
ncbi:MAG TPA: O-antigen ligase family protein [Candidatus Limnocylindria bacterium]|nr:O-antigen ligase family protein [Candidatus Limnocylindria bacterium]